MASLPSWEGGQFKCDVPQIRTVVAISRRRSMVTGRAANHWVVGSMTEGAWPCPDMHVAAISRYMTYYDDYKIILDYDNDDYIGLI